jgi:hypothetical protein
MIHLFVGIDSAISWPVVCAIWSEAGVSRTNLDLTMGASESKPVVLPVRGPETPIKVDTTVYRIPPTAD